MSITRISTYARHQTTLQNVNVVQKRLYDTQDQLSSGIKTRDFKGLTGQVEQFTGLEAKIKRTDEYIKNNQVAVSRLQSTNKALDQIIDIADNIKNLIILRRNPANANSIAFEQQLVALRQTFAGQLNSNEEGRYLFSGTKTNIPPVIEDPIIPEPVNSGVPDDNYYQGGKDDIILRAQENIEIRYNVRADDEGFQQLFASISLALEAHSLSDTTTDQKLANSLQMVSDGLQRVITVQSEVNANTVIINDINDRHDGLKLYWKGLTETVSKTDVLAASTQVAMDQAVLQASFQSFAQLNRLRLVDYL